MRAILLTFFTFIVFSVSASGDDVRIPRTLSLSASSDINVAPNVAYLSIGVTTEAVTAKDAVSQNAIKMKAVVDALQKALGTNGKVQTGYYQVAAAQRYDETTRKNVSTGYSVNNQVRVETANLDVGPLIDAAIAAGSNQIQSVQFSRTDMDVLMTEATVAAIQKGKADAVKMAAGAGVALGNVLSISTSGTEPGPLFKEMRMTAMASDVQTPVIPGEITVSASITMVFAIQSLN